MFRLFWVFVLAGLALVAAWMVLKVVLLLVVAGAAFLVGVPLFALWLAVDPVRRRNRRDWEAREYEKAFTDPARALRQH